MNAAHVRSRVQWASAFVYIHTSALRGVSGLIDEIELQHRITSLMGRSERTQNEEAICCKGMEWRCHLSEVRASKCLTCETRIQGLDC